MIDSKTIVGAALTGDSALSALLGTGDRVFYWMPPTEAVYPCIVFRVSIHAPAQGATQAAATPIGAKLVSIHAPAQGATANLKTYITQGL